MTSPSTSSVPSPSSTASAWLPDDVTGATPAQWREESRHPSDDPPPTREPSPRITRGSLAALLGLTALLYLWDLGASAYGNDFYAAAVQAGTKSWKAFFFGSFDSANFITVDKPPASLWPMELSGRIFGFNSWSMLAPQAIEGVLAVWLLYATVRRWFGHWAGLLAGGLLAITPVAVLMFRFNNPDSLMLLLMVAAAYCTTRAIELASTRWLLLAGVTMGFAFLAKGLQPFTLVPALAAAYLVAAPTSWGRRVLQLLGAGLGIVVGAGWWVLAVQLTPAADRPYIGGSGNNSPLGLAFGYNGLSRLSGNTGSGPGGGFDGSSGIGRMFNSLNGGQIAWLLPTALLAVVALAVLSRRAALTDRTRAAVILFGGWLLVTGVVLSFAGGIIHTYYTNELAPAIAALVAIGAVVLWRARELPAARLALAAGVVISGVWGYELLHRTPSFYSWLAILLVVLGLAGGGLMLLRPGVLRRGALVAAAVVGVVTLGGGSAAYSLDAARTPHTGSTPTAGPATGGGFGFGGAGGRGGIPGGFPSRGNFPRGDFPVGNFPGFPGGTLPSGSTPPSGVTAPGGTVAANRAPGGAAVSSKLVSLLKQTDTTWAAATIGSQSAGPLELATGKAVMSIGGFSGSDAAPTLAQFEKYVRAGKIHYFISSGAFGGFGGARGPGGSGTGSSAITAWVSAHYKSTTVGSSTVYDLTKASS